MPELEQVIANGWYLTRAVVVTFTLIIFAVLGIGTMILEFIADRLYIRRNRR